MPEQLKIKATTDNDSQETDDATRAENSTKTITDNGKPSHEDEWRKRVKINSCHSRSPAKHSGTLGSLCLASVCLSDRPSMCLSVR